MLSTSWKFYGRKEEERHLQKITARGRWFFCQISGRRRIGKTTLITRLLDRTTSKRLLYVQIPDSDESGVLQAIREALEDFEVPNDRYPPPRNLQELAKLVGRMTETEYYVVLDEFQYFHRKQINSFCSFLQAEVDRLLASNTAAGGLFVLGSLHSEMMAILEDRNSPLFNRVTDRLLIPHLSFETLQEMWLDRNITDPYHQLFLWTLFEGIPKFYRDCFEQECLEPNKDYRTRTLESVFFRGSSPLRNEADNWFLNEFRGRYESVLRIISGNNGCTHARIMDEYTTIQSGGEEKQVSGYLATLVDKFQIIEKKLPIFELKLSRKSRYYVTDNFLLSWLGAIDRQIKAARVRPLPLCIEACSKRLEVLEGLAFEKMIRLIIEELSRNGDSQFQITSQVAGYWNRPDDSSKSIEIDHISYNEEEKWVRFASCKRSVEVSQKGV